MFQNSAFKSKAFRYTLEKYLQCKICNGSGRVYPFQKEKLGVSNGCIPCKATGYIKESDYNNINFNENDYFYNRPKDGKNPENDYTLQNATQGQFNPLEQKDVEWERSPEEISEERQ